jgi:hypothetical protein
VPPMQRGTGLFWLLVVVLFGGAGYFGVSVARMKHPAAPQAASVASGGGQAP